MATLRKKPHMNFAFNLLLHARNAGGHLSINKNNRTGTLFEAIDFLRPHLPPSFFPKVLPAGTLALIATEANRLFDYTPPQWTEK